MATNPSAPLTPADSAEETDSGLGSEELGSDESEEVAYSPPYAAPNNTAPPPPHDVRQPGASDEEEEGEDEEEEEEEEDDDDEEEEEEEDQAKVNQATSPSPTTNPPPSNAEEPVSKSESEEEEEDEETDDEAPQSNPAPNQEAQGECGKPPASSEDKKPARPFARVWSKDDNVRILEALAAHRREHGNLPRPDELEAALADSLDHSHYGRKELLGKVKSLKTAYTRQFNKGGQPSKDTDRRIYDLSKEVWGRGDMPANPRDFAEMCELYPHLAEEMKGVENTHPGLFKREFCMISEDKARTLDAKVKKQRLMQGKVELLRYNYLKEVIKTLTDLVAD